MTEEAKLDYGERKTGTMSGGEACGTRNGGTRLTLPQRARGRRRSQGRYVDAGVRRLRIALEVEIEV